MKLAYLKLLQLLAKLQLAKNHPLIIGVTGSAGKSSAVAAIALTLSNQFKVKATKKGNSETGLPMEILNILVGNFALLDWLLLIPQAFWQLLTYWPNYEILIAEVAIDSDLPPKNMDWQLSLIKPDIAVFLNANHVHLANFKNKTLAGIISEKGKLVQAAQKLAILNYDQTTIRNIKHISTAKKYFSLQEPTDIYLERQEANLAGSQFIFNLHQQTYQINFKRQIIFPEFFGSLASAILIADYLGLDINKSLINLANFRNLPGRGQVFVGIKDSILIDSSYNSSLEPTVASLKLLKNIKHEGRKVAVLGDMRELGVATAEDHRQLAKIANQSAGLIITVGPATEQYFPNNNRTHKFANAYQALEFLQNNIRQQDLILIKGSQNTIFLEIVVAGLLKNPADQKYLCRRGKYWDKQRGKFSL